MFLLLLLRAARPADSTDPVMPAAWRPLVQRGVDLIHVSGTGMSIGSPSWAVVFCVGGSPLVFDICWNPNEAMSEPIEVRGQSFVPGEPLADTWKRLEWADSDGRALDTALIQFRATNPYGVKTHFNGQDWEVSFRRFLDPLTESRWSDRLTRDFRVVPRQSPGRPELPRLSGRLPCPHSRPNIDRPAPEAVEFPIFRRPGRLRENQPDKEAPRHIPASL